MSDFSDFDPPETPPPAPNIALWKPTTTTAEELRDKVARSAPPVVTAAEFSGKGHAPPYNAEAEESLLCCCLMDGGETLAKCHGLGLTGRTFHVPANRVIFEKLSEVQLANPPLALEKLVGELRTSRQLSAVGGVAYLMQVSSRLPTTASAGYFIQKVRELEVLRDILALSNSTIEDVFNYAGGINELAGKLKDRIEEVTEAATGRVLDPGRPATDFTYPPDDDPDILIGGEDFVGRGGAFMLVSVTGSGKSPLQLDMCMDWALGWPWHGLRCSGPLKSLIIQHEDSDRYLGKIIGSYTYANSLDEPQMAAVKQNVIVKSLRGCNGADFYRELERLKRLHKPDIIGINPLYLYARGDITKPEAALECITNLERINADKHAAYFIVHHTGKPPTKEGKQYSDLEDWEAIYMGIGSSYWANWPRASMFLQPTAEIGHYLLRLGKGALNAGLVQKVPQGTGYRLDPVTQLCLKHSVGKIKVAGRDRPLVIWEADGDAPARGAGKDQVEQKLSAGIDMETFLGRFPNPDQPGIHWLNVEKELRQFAGQNNKVWAEMQRIGLQQKLIREANNLWWRTTPGPPKPPVDT
jgi:hypothetical protein